MLGEKSRLVSSEYLSGIAKSAFDEDITRHLHAVPAGYAGSEMTIAIENESGVIYRIITTSGISAYQHVSTGLVRLGFEDRLANDFSGKYSYSCIFRSTARS